MRKLRDPDPSEIGCFGSTRQAEYSESESDEENTVATADGAACSLFAFQTTERYDSDDGESLQTSGTEEINWNRGRSASRKEILQHYPGLVGTPPQPRQLETRDVEDDRDLRIVATVDRSEELQQSSSFENFFGLNLFGSHEQESVRHAEPEPDPFFDTLFADNEPRDTMAVESRSHTYDEAKAKRPWLKKLLCKSHAEQDISFARALDEGRLETNRGQRNGQHRSILSCGKRTVETRSDNKTFVSELGMGSGEASSEATHDESEESHANMVRNGAYHSQSIQRQARTDQHLQVPFEEQQSRRARQVHQFEQHRNLDVDQIQKCSSWRSSENSGQSHASSRYEPVRYRSNAHIPSSTRRIESSPSRVPTSSLMQSSYSHSTHYHQSRTRDPTSGPHEVPREGDYLRLHARHSASRLPPTYMYDRVPSTHTRLSSSRAQYSASGNYQPKSHGQLAVDQRPRSRGREQQPFTQSLYTSVHNDRTPNHDHYASRAATQQNANNTSRYAQRSRSQGRQYQNTDKDQYARKGADRYDHIKGMQKQLSTPQGVPMNQSRSYASRSRSRIPNRLPSSARGHQLTHADSFEQEANEDASFWTLEAR